MSKQAPLIVGLGGGAGHASSTNLALGLALAQVEQCGLRTRMIGGQQLSSLPLYLTAEASSSTIAKHLIDAIREADGLIIASPAYHGSVSGAVKNAIDYIQDTWQDPRPYLDNLPVGLIAVAGGYQAAVSTLATLRTITHSLRGWPTPFGAAIISSGGIFQDGACRDDAVKGHLELVGTQVAQFAKNSPYATSEEAITA